MPYYIVFNAGLLEVATGPNECAVMFVDDVVYLAIGNDFDSTHSTLHDMMTRDGGAIRWADEHNSRFEYSKLALMDFMLSPTEAATSSPLQLPSALVSPFLSTRYLGVLFDPKLLWKPQRLNAIRKGSTYVLALRRLARPASGLAPKLIRRLYTSERRPPQSPIWNWGLGCP
jgi:hypothetical protein